jgi:tetratricopeptide (TPR) repeat protein
MKQRIAWILVLLPALVSAAPTAISPDDLVRRGNEALAQQQYTEALKLYDRAGERTTDPGLVAFDAGVALYQQGDYARAEGQFRLAYQDAAGRRRPWVDYNLASALIKTAGDRGAAKLAEAVGLLEDCLQQLEPDDPLAADARHNLELARMLWLEARARSDPQKDRPPQEDEDPTKPQPPRPEPVKQPGGDDGSGNPAKGPGQRELGKEQGQQAVGADGQPLPGEGALPTIPDREELVPMSREEAEAHLRQAVERVLNERRAHVQRPATVPSGKVRDW